MEIFKTSKVLNFWYRLVMYLFGKYPMLLRFRICDSKLFMNFDQKNAFSCKLVANSCSGNCTTSTTRFPTVADTPVLGYFRFLSVSATLFLTFSSLLA